MNSKKVYQRNDFFSIFKVIVFTILFYSAITFENARGTRLHILIVIFIAFITFGVIRRIFLDRFPVLQLFYVVDIALIYTLEYYSRFQINYFIHSFYIFLLLEIAVSLNRKNSLIIGAITVVVSLVKYSMLVYYIPNLVNISQMAFFGLINIFLLIITAFAQYYREEKNKKDMLYKELLDVHRRLKKYADEVEKLTIVAERNRIARDIHDTLGHSVTGIIMEIEMAQHLIDKDLDKSRELLDRAKNSSKEGLSKIREVVETLKPDEEISKGIISIKELISDFSKRTGANIDIDITGDVIKTKPTINMVLYRIVQEGLTNAIRHGQATKINVRLKYSKDKIFFVISDNGIGCGNISEGFGLKGMKERIFSLKGTVDFNSNEGFTVKGFLPIGGRYID